MLMLGGPDAPGVDEALQGKVAEPPPKSLFKPITWNKYRITVINQDNTRGSSSVVQRMRIR